MIEDGVQLMLFQLIGNLNLTFSLVQIISNCQHQSEDLIRIGDELANYYYSQKWAHPINNSNNLLLLVINIYHIVE